MKQEARKNKKWLWLAAGLLALLAVAGVVLALLLPGGAEQDPETVSAELYWNVDRLSYTENAEVEGTSTRTPGADGTYYIRYAYKGEQIDLPIIDKQLVNWLDQRDLVGLIFDEEGVVVDAVEPEEVAQCTAKNAYISNVNGNELTLNSSIAMNGMETLLVCTGNTGIYDVDRKAEVVGANAEPGLMDQVTVYSNEEGEVTHIYITERAPNADIYWRVERMYDSTKGVTTRVPDENGVYSIEFALDGEHVTLKTKDVSLVNYVDSQALLIAAFAPVFDDEGYIVEFVNVALCLRGKLAYSDYHITGIDGDTITATKISSGSEQGRTVTFTMNGTCRTYMCCSGCYEHLVGEKITELKLYDRFNLYTDLDGNPVMMFVTRRMVDCPVYYNLERMYAKGKTSREPVNGYYVFEMAAEGKKVTVRTKDEKLANEIDSLYHQAMGLELNGDIVERVYPLSCVNGGGDYGTNRYITTLSAPIFEVTYYTDFSNKANGMMSADCKIYDVTTGFYGVKPGEETTINLYDKITYLKDLNGEICTIFVTDRYVDAPVYYNLNRKYDSKAESTTREPDADGYYVFDMISGGKQVQVKTRNKALASFMDKQNSPFVALKVSGGIVKEAYPAVSTVKYGYKTANYHYVDKINKDGSFNTYYIIDGEKHKSTYTFHMTEDCKVYDVSVAYDKTRGERTKLKVGDQIQAFAVYPSVNPDPDIQLIYVMNRKLSSPMYKNVQQMYNWTTKETTRVPNEDGWYIFDLAANGTVRQYKTKDKAIATQVDSYDLGFTLVTDGDIITRVCSPTLCKDVQSSVGSYQDVMSLNGNKASLKRNQPNAANYGATTDVTFAKNCVFYDCSPYAKNFGEKTTLSVGDRIHCYTNQDGEVVICFILYKNTHEKGYISHCDHCGQDVFWNPYTGSVGTPDAHYYVTHDGNIHYQGIVGNSTAAKEDQTDVVIDLNGHAMTTTNRGFLVYGTLSILDTVGGGSITAGNKANGSGGCIMVTNDGVLNLYDGVLTVDRNGGKAAIGGVVYLGGKATMNMYGGKVTGGYATDRGGNIINNGCTLNISGGIVENGYAEKNGNNIIATMGSTVNISGGKIGGDLIINSKSKVTLSGSPVITKGQLTGMSLATGVILDVDGLKPDASVVISANGFFTGELTDAQALLPVFIKEKASDNILVKDSALYYEKAPKDLNDADNSALAFEPGTTKAYCPYCERTVTWTELTSTDKKVELTGGEHYYLAEDITYSGSEWLLRAPSTDAVSCFHLNGHNITATNGRLAQGYPGILNIMGEGIVSGNFTIAAAKDQGATINTNTNNSNGAINLIGGIYTAPDTNTQNSVVSVAGNGGTVNIYDGAKIESGSKAYSVHIGVAALTDGTFGMYGGTLSGSIYLSAPYASAGHRTILNISGGTVKGGIQFASTTTVNLSGDPVVSGMGMIVPAGAKINLDGLTQGADILISASGIFTEENEKAADYTGFFTPVDEKAEVIADGNALRYTFPGALELDADGCAVCEACGENVKWTALSDQVYKPANGGHYYFKSKDGSGVVSTPWQLITWPDDMTTDFKLCLHLNGQRVETASRALMNQGTLNIMGEGVLAGTGTTATTSLLTGTLSINGGTVNLYGGTYTSEASGVPAITTYYASATVNLIKADVIGGVNVKKGTLSLGGTSTVTGANGELTGNISVDAGKLLVKSDWTGTASVSFKEITSNPLSTDTGAAEGAFVGKLYLEGDPTYEIVANNGALEIPGYVISGGGDNDDVVNEGTLELDADGNAYCEACDKTVKWTAVSSQVYQPVDGGHYYFMSKEGNGVVSTPYQLITWPSGVTAAYRLCLHLNGHRVETGSRAMMNTGTLNIMGAGTLAGTGTTTSTDLLTGTLSINGGVVNLYGGTYTSEISSAPAVAINYSSATVNLINANVHGGIEVKKGNLTLGGASSVTGVDGQLQGNIHVAEGKLLVKSGWTGTASASFDALSGEVIPAENGQCEGAYTGKLYLEDAGNSVIQGEDTKLVVMQSHIIKAEKVAKEAATAITDKWCPVCEKAVTWTRVRGQIYGPVDGGHYYFQDDTNSGSTNTDYDLINWMSKETEGYTVCLHLNGNTVKTARRAMLSSGTMNIMGTGTLECTGNNATNVTGTLTVAGGTVNLYGGTYISTDPKAAPVILMNSSKDAVINVYNDVVIGGEAGTATGTNAVITKGTLNMYGGTIRNGIGYASGEKLYGGNLYLESADAQFNMYGGTVCGGTAAEGGNIYVKNAAVKIFDKAVISGGSATAFGGNIHGSYGSVTTGGQIIGGHTTGTAAHGGNISVSGTVLTVNGGEITGGVAAGQGGNIRCWNATLNMSGGVVYGGRSDAAANENIWLAGTTTMTMTGGTVKGVDGTNDSGTAISTSQTATLILGGTANVLRDDGIANGNIAISSTASLKILNDWAGNATVRWNTAYDANAAIEADRGACGQLSGGTFTAGGSYIGKLVQERGDRLAVQGVNGVLTVAAAAAEDEDSVLKILGIGNSFTWDSMHMLYEVYRAENPDKQIVLGILNYSGCSLAKHVEFITADTGAYYYHKLSSVIYANSGTWEILSNTSMKTALLNEKWDIVSLQQNSSNTPNASTYNGDIGTIRQYIVETLGYEPEFAWNFTWGYPDDEELLNTSTTAGFANSFKTNYGTTLNMYNKISAAVQEKIVGGSYQFDYLMPSGTAVQNAREYLTAKDLYRDYCHLNNLGRLVAAYTWYCELEGVTLTDLKLTQIPADLALTNEVSNGVTTVDAELENVIIESVNNAMANKFAVTKKP